jgi:FKBP-type peptidyl-prolyl cis-trans isomerase SlyD
MQVADGVVVTLEYTVTLADGEILDTTGRCGPMAVMVGSGQLFPALEDRIAGMRAGETRTVRIPPEDAYGERRQELIRMIPRDRLPPDLAIEVGGEYRMKGPDGRMLRFRVTGVVGDEVEADFNSPHAGQALVATVTIVGVRGATADEERRGRV